MSIHAAIQGGAFSPEDVAILVAAFEDACLELGLKAHDDLMTEIVAKAIVSVGRQRVSDPETLKNRALLLLRNGNNALAS
jgi:hypothetical protein